MLPSRLDFHASKKVPQNLFDNMKLGFIKVGMICQLKILKINFKGKNNSIIIALNLLE